MIGELAPVQLDMGCESVYFDHQIEGSIYPSKIQESSTVLDIIHLIFGMQIIEIPHSRPPYILGKLLLRMSMTCL
jgi:hypothetical protein